jgi:hypothetical protein
MDHQRLFSTTPAPCCECNERQASELLEDVTELALAGDRDAPHWIGQAVDHWIRRQQAEAHEAR